MIQANELRIGNYVYDDFKEVHRVENVQSSIPLTEEWLLNFGFFKSIVFNGYDIRKGSLIINLERNGDDFLVVFLKITGREDLNSIKYVHQLQNLYFALTGQELEVKP